MPESKKTDDTTDKAVEPVESTDDVVDEDADVADVAAPAGDDDAEVEGELVDVPEELREDEGSAAAGATTGKADKAGKAATDKKPGKPGKTVKPPRVKRAEKAKKSGTAPRKVPKQRRWVAPLMLACWLIGLAWLVVFYVAGSDIPYMKDLNNWNLLIGMGLIALGFVVSTQWV